MDLTAFEARIDSGKSGGHEGGGIEDITKPKSYLSRELSNEKLLVSIFFYFILVFYEYIYTMHNVYVCTM